MRPRAGLAVVAALAAGCGGAPPAADEAPPPPPPAAAGPAPAAPAAADPREDGVGVALGEWALTVEARAIRPGPVTFVIVNRGAVPHGFELELEESESGDDGLKVETRVLQPGERVRLHVELPAGLYKLECLVDGHDDLGMEELLEVRPDAPLVAPEAPAGGGNAVAISAFAYEPAELTVSAGESVTWTNEDPAGHTVTHEGDAFASETLDRGASFRMRFDEPGRYRYLCALHPEMRGTVVVSP